MNIYYYGKMFFRVKQKFPNGLEVMFDETGMKFVSLEKVDSPKLFWTHFKFIIRSELMGIYAFCHKENESFTIVFKKELGDRFL